MNILKKSKDQSQKEEELPFTIKKIKHQNVSLNMQECLSDCTKDTYSVFYQQITQYYVEKKLPPRLEDLPLNRRISEKNKFRNALPEYQIIKCKAGTLHLWRRKRTPQSYSRDPYKRVPMEKQKVEIAKILHGKSHRNQQDMLEIVLNSDYFYPDLQDFILLEFEKICELCPATMETLVEKKKKEKERQKRRQIQVEEKHEKTREKRMQKWAKKKRRMKMSTAYKRIKEKIEKRNCHFQKEESEDYKLILICGKGMWMNYYLFGECLFIQTVTTKDGKVYFFYGVDEHGRAQIFSIGVILGIQSSNHIKKLYDIMLSNIKQNPPFLMMTPYSKNLYSSIQVEHTYFYGSIMEQVPQNAEQTPYFSQLLTTPSKETAKSIASTLMKKSQVRQLVKQVMKEKEKCCYSFMPKMFMGQEQLRMSTGDHLTIPKKSLLNIERVVEHGLDYQQMIEKTPNIERPLIPKDWVILYQLEKVLSGRLLRELLLNCVRSRAITIVTENPSQVVVEEPSKSTLLLYFSIQSHHWLCECGGLQRTGIPCPHLIRVLLLYGGCLKYYINQRWLL